MISGRVAKHFGLRSELFSALITSVSGQGPGAATAIVSLDAQTGAVHANFLIRYGFKFLFNFWTFGAVLYLKFCEFLLNKSPDFPNFFGLLLETVFYLKLSSITEVTVYQLAN